MTMLKKRIIAVTHEVVMYYQKWNHLHLVYYTFLSNFIKKLTKPYLNIFHNENKNILPYRVNKKALSIAMELQNKYDTEKQYKRSNNLIIHQDKYKSYYNIHHYDI